MNPIQPLLDIQQNLRIEHERIETEIEKLKKLLKLPLQPCAFCKTQDAKLVIFLRPNEPKTHSLLIRCLCGIETQPQTCFENEPTSFYSAISHSQQIWNGHHHE